MQKVHWGGEQDDQECPESLNIYVTGWADAFVSSDNVHTPGRT